MACGCKKSVAQQTQKAAEQQAIREQVRQARLRNSTNTTKVQKAPEPVAVGK